MLSHLLRPQIEAEAAQKGERALAVFRFNLTRNKLMWGLFAASVLLAFAVVLSSVVVATRHVAARSWIYVGVGIAILIVAVSEHFRTNLAFLNQQTRNAWVSLTKLRVRIKSDFLFPHTLAAYGFVVIPAVLSVLLLPTLSVGWAKPGTLNYTAFADLLKQLIAFAGLLLAAQIALFNFMFGQLLGKYSSAMAVAVSSHRVVQILRGYLIVLLVALLIFYLFGFPDALPKVAFFLALSLAATLILTIWVSNTGIRVDQAILYAGHHSAALIGRLIKPPVLKRSRFWNTMADFGLDWRNPERMVVTLPPENASSVAMTLASGLFNAAHKSIQENQHETFWSSLVALSFATEAYVKRRRDYLGSGDQVLSYLNDQLAALAKAAAKAPNEYMVTNVVTTIGTIGTLALEVGRGPELHDVPKAQYPESHPNFVHWQALLSECFQLTHGLMRTTAASEVLTQLIKLTKKSIDLGYAEDASMSFPAELNRIYATCLAKRTPYLLSLAGQCVRAVMDVWNYSLGRPETAMAGVSRAMADTVKTMLVAFQTVEKSASFDLKDPVTTVTSKLGEEQVTLQDIALSILSRPVKDDWQRRAAERDFEELLNLVTELSKDAAGKEISFARQYGDAFYDFAVLVFTVLPNEWNEPEHEAQKYFQIQREPVHEKFENKIAETVKELLPLHYRAKRPVLDWEHGLFSIIGMAAAIYSETGRESARLLATDAILCYRDLIAAAQEKGRVRDDDWDWLQLASVWVRHLVKDAALADALVDEVATGRPFSFGVFLSGGKHGWGIYGYPNISLGSDFHVMWPRNVGHRLSETVRKTVKRWQDLLTNPEQLRDTYERIEKIREPIRKRLMKQYEREKQQQRPRKSALKAEPSVTDSKAQPPGADSGPPSTDDNVE
jgi:hypothetical protein